MYDGVLTQARTPGGKTKDFPIRNYQHQGSSFSYIYLTCGRYVLTDNIKEEVHMCMLFTDDIIILAESRETINAKLEIL